MGNLFFNIVTGTTYEILSVILKISSDSIGFT